MYFGINFEVQSCFLKERGDLEFPRGEHVNLRRGEKLIFNVVEQSSFICPAFPDFSTLDARFLN